MSIRLLLSELKRRQVYRALLVYATASWALLEGADIVLPRLGFETESVTLVLILVVACFPIAVYLAWIYDITPDGIIRTPPLSPGVKHKFSWARVTEFLVIGGLVAVVGYLYVDRLTLQAKLAERETATADSYGQADMTTTRPENYRAVAVLPFADMSEAGDQGWFAEGIAEEVLVALSQVEDLNVMARTSSFAFKDSGKTIAEIAEILRVQAVLEGSVRRSGDRVRISAQLVDAASGYRLWSDSYERQIADIFQLQDELAKSVVSALGIELGFSSSDRLIKAHTENMEAYNLFIRGRALYDWSTAETHLKSIRYFEKAVETDPNYALAWGYLASALAVSVVWRPVDDVYPDARFAYDRALALHPEQSEALAAKATMAVVKEWDWNAAGELFQRSMARGETIWARVGYAAFLLPAVDKLRDAVSLYQEAERLDPLHPGIKANLALFLLYSGDATAAIKKGEEALELEPGHLFAFMALIEAYTLNGQYPQAKAILDKVPKNLYRNTSIRSREGLYYAFSGNLEMAREIYREIVGSPYPVPMAITSALALALEDAEGAIDLLESVAEENAYSVPWIRALYRQHDMLEEHPRYLALLKRIGLDDESVAALNQRLSFD